MTDFNNNLNNENGNESIEDIKNTGNTENNNYNVSDSQTEAADNKTVNAAEVKNAEVKEAGSEDIEIEILDETASENISSINTNYRNITSDNIKSDVVTADGEDLDGSHGSFVNTNLNFENNSNLNNGSVNPVTGERYSGVNYQNMHPQTYYTENIKNKRKFKHKGVVAAVLAITVLNLSAMGGMFYMGNKLGKEGRTVASKQALMDSLRGGTEDTAGAKQTVTSGNELSTTEIAKKVGPAVVGIKSTIQGQMTIFGTAQASESEGSGIIISEDGYIVTNNHVVDGASAISVQLNTGTEIEAKLIGKDSQTDLAVIKIEPTEELTVATLGDSTNIEVGERVVAIGNPMGLEFFGTVTQGIVSGVNRSITVDNRTMNVIQTDAAINSGNSGGALINRFGEVIGINSVKMASSGVEGMGFAIPSSEFKPIISDLLEHGYVKGRPVIGISTRDVTEYMARSYSWPQGVQVMEITSESAKSAGLAQGDIITEVDGQKVTDTESLNTIKNSHNPGDVLKMTVYKYATGKTETVQVTLSEQLPN